MSVGETSMLDCFLEDPLRAAVFERARVELEDTEYLAELGTPEAHRLLERLEALEARTLRAGDLTPRELDLAELLEQSAGGLVFQGDALEVMRGLPDSCADALVMDPPYCSGGFSETGKRASKGMTELSAAGKSEWFAGDNMGTAGLVWLLRGIAVQARRVLKPGGHVLCFTDWRMEPHLKPLDAATLGPILESAALRHQKTVVWDKLVPGMGNGFKPTHEQILHLVKGKGSFYAVDGRDVIRCARIPSKRRFHPTEKPQDLLKELIRVTTPEGGLVVDPFAGSGSCGVAALSTGRSWIGAELSTTFCDVIRHRLAGAADSRPGQGLLFTE